MLEVIELFYGNPGGFIRCLASIFVRIAGFIRHISFLGSALRISLARNVIVLALCIIILPHIISNKAYIPLGNIVSLGFIGDLITEFILGYIIGFSVGMPFYIAQTAGAFSDAAKGASSMLSSGLSRTQDSVTSTLLTNACIVHILVFPEYLFVILNVLCRSFVFLPYGFSFNVLAEEGVLRIILEGSAFVFNDIILASSRLAAPILILSLCSDLSFSLVNRLMPRVQITFLSVPVKSVASLLIVSIAWNFLFRDIEGYVFKSAMYITDAFG